MRAPTPRSTRVRTPLRSLHQHVKRFRQQRRVQAGSLIVSIFGDAVLPRGGCIWLGSLIRLLEPLGVSERLVRTAASRLVKDGWLRTQSLGRRSNYLLTDTGRRRFGQAARRIYASSTPPWDRHWRLILLVGDLNAKERERIRKALFWQGFGTLNGDCCVHPNADLVSAFDALAAEGLGAYVPRLMPLQSGDGMRITSTNNGDLVRRAWNLEGLRTGYDAFIRAYQPIYTELASETGSGVAEEDAFLVRVLLIHDYRRLLLRDPGLPDALLPRDWPGQEARRLCRDIYRSLMVPSERHLTLHLQLADGSTPAADASLKARFSAAPPG
ncbi:phenylacetic acid degradation operon negative regulatory protein PaaX [bacterium]|nr:MAG: phenylacetic acid degradation operon negative regulatory protein PaaX [bacterium]